MGFRQIVPRSASRVAKLCTGRSPGVRLVAALARARGERAAGSTALVRQQAGGLVVVGEQRGQLRVAAHTGINLPLGHESGL